MKRGQVVGPDVRRREQRDRTALDVPSHGASGYYRGCRCDACTDACADVQRRTRARQRGELAPYVPPRGEHGRISQYNKGCRCDDCREMARVQRARFRAEARQRALVRAA